MLKNSFIFWVKFNNLHQLKFRIIIFSNHKKKSRGVMKKIFHPHMHNTHHTLRFFLWLENEIISNYNGSKLLNFPQKIKESLSTRVSACSEASVCIYIYILKLNICSHKFIIFYNYKINIYKVIGQTIGSTPVEPKNR